MHHFLCRVIFFEVTFPLRFYWPLNFFPPSLYSINQLIELALGLYLLILCTPLKINILLCDPLLTLKQEHSKTFVLLTFESTGDRVLREKFPCQFIVAGIGNIYWQHIQYGYFLSALFIVLTTGLYLRMFFSWNRC